MTLRTDAEQSPSAEERMQMLKAAIASCFARIKQLKDDMAAWYAAGQSKRFPHYQELAALEIRLSALDSEFKQLWDAKQARKSG
ncbi:MAG: hypothetical protein AB1717_00225 [Pseudomonadota bacterium]